jgi:hypothetical protein
VICSRLARHSASRRSLLATRARCCSGSEQDRLERELGPDTLEFRLEQMNGANVDLVEMTTVRRTVKALTNAWLLPRPSSSGQSPFELSA